jgi:SAM-dependent methyltransferase
MSGPDTQLLGSGLGLGKPNAPRTGWSSRSPAVSALLAHLPGVACAAALVAFGAQLPLPWLIMIISGGAALLAWYWRLPLWWRYINLFFLPLAGVGLYFQNHLENFDPDWYLLAFALLALTSIGAVRTRVPLYLSSPRAADELARRLPKRGHVIDLGCGFGGPLARIHQLRPDARLDGIEAAPLNWLIAKLRMLARGADADIRLGNLWHVDLTQYDIVYAYLSPAPMARLWDKALLEMKPGSLFISNTFAITDADAGFDADEIIDISKPGDITQARLLIWRM